MQAKLDQAAQQEGQELRQQAGLWMKSLREALNLSQRDLANRLELDYYTFISQLENGRGRIPTNRFRAWAKALEVDEKVFVKQLLMYYEPITYDILFGQDAA